MTQKEQRLLTIMAVGLSILLILRDIAGIGMSKFIFLGYVVLFAAIVQHQTLVYMVCFIMPLACGLPGTYIMPCLLVLLIIKRKRMNAWQIGMILFVAIMELLASLWYPVADFPAIVQYISFAGVLFFLIHDKTELDYSFCVQIYLYGVCLLCGIIVAATLVTAPSNWLELFARGHFRFGETQSDYIEGMKLSLNANSLAYYSITGMCCGILMAERAAGRERLWYILLAVFASLAGMLSLSRSWLLVGLICLLLYIFSKLRNVKQFVTVIAVLIGVYLGVSLLFGKNPELLVGFRTRFSDETFESDGGRTEIFLDYMNVFTQVPRLWIIGSGVTQYKDVTGVYSSFHNGTQQILVSYGVLGFAAFLLGLIKPVVDVIIKKTHKKTMYRCLPLLGVILFVQTIQFLNPMMLMLPYIIGIYALKTGEKINEDISDNGGHRGR